MTTRRPLIVVLPGIGGSVLARREGRRDVVWDAGTGDIADLVVRTDRMSIEESPHLQPLGLTESTKFLGFTVVPGYEKLLDQLSEFGVIDRRGDPEHPVANADVVAVPYDFRRSIVEAAERLDAVVCAYLRGTSQAERAGRVIVVAHSLGGLVARAWMGLLGRWPWCRSLITLGTPHRGAPKALQWLVNGVLLKGPTEMLRGWPSIVQLLPRYPAIRNRDVTQPDDVAAALYPFQLSVPWLTGRAAEAYGLHVALEYAWRTMPRSGPETVACIGWSHPTMCAAYWEHGRLQVTKDLPDWLGLDGWEKDFGDGTVPSFSALPPEMDNHEHSPIRVADRHGPLAHTQTVADLLRRQLSRHPPTAVHGAANGEHPPTIGLDLDELHPARAPIRLSAALREVTADVSGQTVWARLRPSTVRERPGPAGSTCRWSGTVGWVASKASSRGSRRAFTRSACRLGRCRRLVTSRRWTQWRWSRVTESKPWSLTGEPLALLRYVQPAEVARHVRLPGPSAESPLRRLRAVYAALKANEIGMQVIRSPEQVLWAPRHATCLDLAVVLAGACLTADLHPIIVILEPTGDAGVAHSLVLVRVDRNLTPRDDGLFDLDVWQQPPADLVDELQHSLDGPGDVVAIDPVGLAVSLGTEGTPGLMPNWPTPSATERGTSPRPGGGDSVWTSAARGGAQRRRRWWTCRRPSRSERRTEPLRAPYRAADTAESPLRLLRAEYALVPFQNRDELTVLRDWCRQTAAGDRTGLAVVTGIGGSGKTRLALQLSARLRRAPRTCRRNRKERSTPPKGLDRPHSYRDDLQCRARGRFLVVRLCPVLTSA